MACSKEREEPALAAQQSFKNKDYASALVSLKELETLVGNNNKRVQHNKAVVEFFAEDMKNVGKFKKTIAQLTGQSFPDIDIRDSVPPFVVYNYAVLLYHSRHYYQCTEILKKLLARNIKDPKLFQQSVLLLLESTLCRRTYDKALELANYHGEKVKTNTDISELYERLVSRAQLLTGNKNKLNLKPDSIENVFVLAQQMYLNGEVKEAADMLGRYKTMKYNYDLKSQGEDIWAAMNNNLGIIYLSIKKPYLATKYLQNAVKEQYKTVESEDKDRLIVCKDRPIYIFNLGLALLSSNNCEGAFECFVEAARHYPNNPRIWMHLAECCIKKRCNDDPVQYTMRKLGSGPHTRILLAKEEKKEKFLHSPGESFAMPSLSLEFAVLCLRNVELLFPKQDPPADVNAPFIQAPPGPPLNWKKRCELMNTTYVLQSYVFLYLNDPQSALTSANDLLAQQEASSTHKAWAHIYAAEALINLDQITEAVEHLHPPMIHDLVSDLPNEMKDMIAISVWAKAAVCHILRGDLATARKILLQINSPKVWPLQMYLEICSGNVENCQSILRKLQLTTANQ